MIAVFAVVTACTDEQDALMEEMVLEVAITDAGVLALTEASEQQLEEAVLAAGGTLDHPLVLRVEGPDGLVVREIAADSYDELMTMIADEGVAEDFDVEKEVEELLAKIERGELEVDLDAWRESVGELKTIFESLDSMKFIEAERKKGK